MTQISTRAHHILKPARKVDGVLYSRPSRSKSLSRGTPTTGMATPLRYLNDTNGKGDFFRGTTEVFGGEP